MVSFSSGDAVELRGLKGAKEHNGRRGVVASFNEAKQRYAVKLEPLPSGTGFSSNKKALNAKAANLRLSEEVGRPVPADADQALGLFSQYDANRDGTLDNAEFQQYMSERHGVDDLATSAWACVCLKLEAHPAYGLRSDQFVVMEEELEQLIDAAGGAAEDPKARQKAVRDWVRNAQHELSAAAAAQMGSEPVGDWESLKNEGNAALKRKDWEGAIGKYSAAMNCTRHPDCRNVRGAAICCTNLAVAHLRCAGDTTIRMSVEEGAKHVEAAVQSTTLATSLCPDYIKGQERHLESMLAAGHWEEEDAMAQRAKLQQLYPMMLEKSGEPLTLLSLGWLAYDQSDQKKAAIAAANWFGVTPDVYLAREEARVAKLLFSRSDEIPASAHTAADGSVVRLPWCVCVLRLSVITLPAVDGQWLSVSITGWPLELTQTRMDADKKQFTLEDLWVRRLDPKHSEMIDESRHGGDSEPLHLARASTLAKQNACAFISEHCNELAKRGVVCSRLVLGAGLMDLLPAAIPSEAGNAAIHQVVTTRPGSGRNPVEMLRPSELPAGLDGIAVSAELCGCEDHVVEACRARSAAAGSGFRILPCYMHARDHARDAAASGEPARIAAAFAAFDMPGGLRDLALPQSVPAVEVTAGTSGQVLKDALAQLDLRHAGSLARSPMASST